MKTFLMHPDRDADATPAVQADVFQDLELDVLLGAAAGGDRFVREVMEAALSHAWTNDLETIRYRQDILKDCLENPTTVRQLYTLAVEPFGRDQSWNFSLYGHDPSSRVGSAVRTLHSCIGVLRRLRRLCASHAIGFVSRGFRQFFDTLERDLDDAYLDAAGADLDNLTFRNGVLLSAGVGAGGKGVHTMLRKPQPGDLSWLQWLLAPGNPGYTLQLHPRDEAGAQAFSELQGRGLSLISGALYQSAEHVLDFMKTLRSELAFYVGCLNLSDRLAQIGEGFVFPDGYDTPGRFACDNLRDVCLAFTAGRPVVGNTVSADGKPLVIVTGANRGGKSTFLRSVGLAQIMLQSGLFVTADAIGASLRRGLFTHYKREEDRSMRSGKFDEELVRMSGIADRVRRGTLVLFNESFAATNEREGSEIARQIVSALLDSGISVFFVSHMYEFAKFFLDDERVLFLRAERDERGERSFRLREAKPLPQSFGADLYQHIFAEAV